METPPSGTGRRRASPRRRLADLAPPTVADIRVAGEAVVAFSGDWQRDITVLRRFLWERMYRHRFVMRTTSKAKRLVRSLFDLYTLEPELMPAEWAARNREGADAAITARAAADFIAGMTDRFAVREYNKLFDMAAFSL